MLIPDGPLYGLPLHASCNRSGVRLYQQVASVRYGLSKAWAVSLSGDNLLDEDYFLSADRKAAPAAGRSVSLRLLWNAD